MHTTVETNTLLPFEDDVTDTVLRNAFFFHLDAENLEQRVALIGRLAGQPNLRFYKLS